MMTLMEIPGTESLVDNPPPRKPNSDEQRRADAEAARLKQRERKKHELAAAHVAQAQLQQIVSGIAAVTERKDKIAAEHVESAKPLQARLQIIEDRQIAAVKSRLPSDPELETERQDLLSQLRSMNTELELAIAAEDSLLRKLEGERIDAAKKSLTCSVEADLLELASPATRVAVQLAGSTARWAKARFDKARERHGMNRSAFSAAELELSERLYAEAAAAERQVVRDAIEE